MCVCVHVCVLHIYTYILSTDNISQHGVSAPQRLPLPHTTSCFSKWRMHQCTHSHCTYIRTYILNTHTHMQNMNVLSIFSSGVAAALSARETATATVCGTASAERSRSMIPKVNPHQQRLRRTRAVFTKNKNQPRLCMANCVQPVPCG